MKLKDYVRSKDFKQPLSEHQFKKYECKGKKATNWSLDDVKKIAKFIGIKITGKKKDILCDEIVEYYKKQHKEKKGKSPQKPKEKPKEVVKPKTKPIKTKKYIYDLDKPLTYEEFKANGCEGKSKFNWTKSEVNEIADKLRIGGWSYETKKVLCDKIHKHFQKQNEPKPVLEPKPTEPKPISPLKKDEFYIDQTYADMLRTTKGKKTKEELGDIVIKYLIRTGWKFELPKQKTPTKPKSTEPKPKPKRKAKRQPKETKIIATPAQRFKDMGPATIKRNICDIAAKEKIPLIKQEEYRKIIRQELDKLIGKQLTPKNLASTLKAKPKIIDTMFNLYDKYYFSSKINGVASDNRCKFNVCFAKSCRGVAGECALKCSANFSNITITLFTDLFKISKERNKDFIVTANGLNCYDILGCMMNVFEHELVHGLLDCYCMRYSESDSGPGNWTGPSNPKDGHSKTFMSITNNRFGHTKFRHSLFTSDEREKELKKKLKVGDKVTYISQTNLIRPKKISAVITEIKRNDSSHPVKIKDDDTNSLWGISYSNIFDNPYGI